MVGLLLKVLHLYKERVGFTRRWSYQDISLSCTAVFQHQHLDRIMTRGCTPWFVDGYLHHSHDYSCRKHSTTPTLRNWINNRNLWTVFYILFMLSMHQRLWYRTHLSSPLQANFNQTCTPPHYTQHSLPYLSMYSSHFSSVKTFLCFWAFSIDSFDIHFVIFYTFKTNDPYTHGLWLNVFVMCLVTMLKQYYNICWQQRPQFFSNF